MRPNFWPNTPDILHEFLQYGGPAAFKLRAVLAATLSPCWGMYSGYELCEHVAVRAGSEEYLDSEKYQFRPRDWDSYAAGGPNESRSIAPYIASLNRIRREHIALQRLRNTAFHRVDDDSIICYSRRLEAGDPDGRGRPDRRSASTARHPRGHRSPVDAGTGRGLARHLHGARPAQRETTGGASTTTCAWTPTTTRPPPPSGL
jgi:starch synthase (maltosyl-transferring)